MRSAETPARRDTLNLRIKPEVRELIDRAARARGKTRTDFILDAVRSEAEQALLDQALLSVDHEVYRKFVERLDEPPAPNARLQETLRSTPPWAER